MGALSTKTPNSKAACRAAAAAEEYESEKWEVKWKAKRKPIILPPTTILTSKSPGDIIGVRTIVSEPGKWAEVIVDSREEQASRKSAGLSFKVKKYSKVVNSPFLTSDDG